jgi:hypothetical protein
MRREDPCEPCFRCFEAGLVVSDLQAVMQRMCLFPVWGIASSSHFVCYCLRWAGVYKETCTAILCGDSFSICVFLRESLVDDLPWPKPVVS